MSANKIPIAVLVIDNDQLLQSMVKGYLTKVGTTKIIQCRNGREALAAFSRDKFDLIIMDWKLKDPTSPEMFKLIKTNPELIKAAMILTAGQFTKNDIAIFKKFPGTSSMLKPISEDVLLNTIAKTHPGAHPKKVKEREKQKNSFAARLAAAQAAAKAREAASENKQIPAATGAMNSGSEKQEMYHVKGGNSKSPNDNQMQSVGSSSESGGMGIYVAKGQGTEGRGLYHDRKMAMDGSDSGYRDRKSDEGHQDNDMVVDKLLSDRKDRTLSIAQGPILGDASNMNLNQKKIIPMFGRGGSFGALADTETIEQSPDVSLGDIQSMAEERSQLIADIDDQSTNDNWQSTNLRNSSTKRQLNFEQSADLSVNKDLAAISNEFSDQLKVPESNPAEEIPESKWRGYQLETTKDLGPNVDNSAGSQGASGTGSEEDTLTSTLDLNVEGLSASLSDDPPVETKSKAEFSLKIVTPSGQRIQLESVLVIERDENLRKTLVSYLADIGVGDVQGFSDGLEAWRRYSDQAFDMVLLDWNAKGLSGLAFYNHICRDKRQLNIPIVVTSSIVKKIDFRVLEDNPCVTFLEKPFLLTDLAKAIGDVVVRVDHYKSLLSSIGEIVQSGIGKSKLLLSIMDEVLKQYPHPLPALIASGKYLLAKSMYVDAAKVLKLAYSIDKKNVSVLTELGKCYHRMNISGEAMKVLQGAEGLSPENIERLCLLGEAGLSLSDPEKAKAYFQKMLATDQHDDDITKSDFEISENMREFMANFSQSKDISKNFSSIMNIVGITYVRNKKYEKGISQYRAAMSFVNDDRTLARLEFNVGLAYLRAKKFEDAKKYFRQASVTGGPEFKKPANFLKKLKSYMPARPSHLTLDVGIQEEELYKVS